RGPAEAVGEPAEQSFDAARAVEARGAAGLAVDHGLLVLGADAPLGARLRAAVEVTDELVATRDRRVQCGVLLDEVRHAGFLLGQRRDRRRLGRDHIARALLLPAVRSYGF